MGKIERSRVFLSEAKQELKKVTWPTRQQTMSSTWVVIVFVFLISIFLGLVDFGLSRAVKYLIGGSQISWPWVIGVVGAVSLLVWFVLRTAGEKR